MNNEGRSAKGRAFGVNREYQVLARGIIQTLRRGAETQLVPCDEDGIDVPIEAGGSHWSFDIALRRPGENKPNLLGECRRWQVNQYQELIAAFAWRVFVVREKYGADIEAIYFTKTGYEPSSIGAAMYAGIDLAVIHDVGQTEQSFVVDWHYLTPDGKPTSTRQFGRAVALHAEATMTEVAFVSKQSDSEVAP